MIPIAHHKTRHGEIVVLMSRSIVAYWQDERHQSEADHGGVSLAAYIHAIHSFLRQSGSRNVLMIGCGGGTLATMLRSDGVKVAIVEVYLPDAEPLGLTLDPRGVLPSGLRDPRRHWRRQIAVLRAGPLWRGRLGHVPPVTGRFRAQLS
jgi:hypothetical protein